jgi:tetratricopeptide (TPR) repeat protein
MRCNGPGMNSWHTISPDGRWMVFAAKPEGAYTRLMLTHLDAEGNDTPAVPLERLVAPERAANIPEFAALSPEAIAAIREDFLDARSHLRAGTEAFNRGDKTTAEHHFRAGLTLDPANAELHFGLGNLLAGQQRLDDAIAELRKAASLSGEVASYREGLARALLANALLNGQPTGEARREAEAALALARRTNDEATAVAAQRLLALCGPAAAPPSPEHDPSRR